MACRVGETLSWGPTNGWDEDVTGMDTDTAPPPPPPATSSRRIRRLRNPSDNAEQECKDIVLIGRDGDEVGCSSAIVQRNAHKLARIVSQHMAPQTTALTRVELPHNAEQLRLLVHALEFKTAVQIPWDMMSLDELLDYTSMLLVYGVILHCAMTIEQNFIERVRYESVKDCGRYESDDPSSSRLFNIAHEADFQQLKALCIERSPQFANSSHLMDRCDDRPTKRRQRS